jgi:hypothetical protein
MSFMAPCLLFAAIVSAVFLGCANLSQVSKVDVHSGGSLFFIKDCLDSADYLALQSDGNYRIVSAEHFFTEEHDHGTWQAQGSAVLLQSTLRPREIETPALEIYLHDPVALRRLPRLREALAALLNSDTRPDIPVNEVKRISIRLPDDYRLHADTATEFDPSERTRVTRDELQRLIEATS